MSIRIPLFAAILALSGCARFPSQSAIRYTRLHFTITFADPIDDRYVYAIAIRRLTTADPGNDTYGPIPVALTGSKNGIVEGRPTHLVLYNRASTQFFTVNTFATRTPTENDPSPVELGSLIPTSEAVIGIDPEAGAPGTLQQKQLEFEISTQDLATNVNAAPIDPSSIIAVQFNVLSMSKTALNSVSDRVMDALGDTSDRGTASFQAYQQRSILTGGRYSNVDSVFAEKADDTFNGKLPAVDIVDWTLDVRTP